MCTGLIFRDYLRLGDPLCCKSLDELTENEERSTTIPVNRVRCIVTMTTPRDVNLHGVAITPPFVEFNMNYEGFGCMYIPSMAPQGPPNPSVVGVSGSTDQTIVGGLGTGERVFPPSAGLTYCSWFCIDRLSTTQYHPVYLLQIVRRLTDQSDSLICLSVSLDCRDKALIISTQEKELPPHGNLGTLNTTKHCNSCKTLIKQLARVEFLHGYSPEFHSLNLSSYISLVNYKFIDNNLLL